MKKLRTILFFLIPFISSGQAKTRDSSEISAMVRKEVGHEIQIKQKAKKNIYELPNSFRGYITIFKSEPCGQKVKTKKGRQLIRIPSDGILIIKDDRLDFSYEVNDRNQIFKYTPNSYYFVDSQNQRKEMVELDKMKFDEGSEQRYSTEGIGIFDLGFGSGEVYGLEAISYSYSEYFVGSYSDLKSINYIERRKKNNEAINKLRRCRGQ